MSEEEMFEATEARSTPSIHSAIDRSVENIAHRKSRVSSQENGKQVTYSGPWGTKSFSSVMRRKLWKVKKPAVEPWTPGLCCTTELLQQTTTSPRNHL